MMEAIGLPSSNLTDAANRARLPLRILSFRADFRQPLSGSVGSRQPSGQQLRHVGPHGVGERVGGEVVGIQPERLLDFLRQQFQ